MMLRVVFAVVFAATAFGSSALAQSTASITARGSAEAGDASSGRSARDVAIDRAFADAVSQQVARELTTSERRRVRAGIDRDIVRRARLFVRSYKVTAEEAIEGRQVVTIAAVLDLGKLGEALGKLGVTVGDTARRPAPVADGARPSIALIVHASRGATVDTTFGARGGAGGPAGTSLAAQLDALGFRVASTRGVTAAASTDAVAELPVGDSAAIELARSVGAGGAVVVGIDVASDGPIRATQLRGAAGRAAVRVLDVGSGAVVMSASLDAAGIGAADAAAIDAVAAMLGRLVGERAGAAMTGHWPSAIAASGNGRVVVVRGAARWASVDAVQRRLGAIPGNRGVSLGRLQSGVVVLVIDTGLSASELARQLGSVALPLGTASARAVGDRVEVEIDGDAEGRD